MTSVYTQYKAYAKNVVKLLPHVVVILALNKIIINTKVVIVSVVLSSGAFWKHFAQVFWHPQIEYRC